MLKWVSLISRRDGMSVEQFRSYWRDVHAPMVFNCPEVLHYTINFIDGKPSLSDVPSWNLDGKFDGIAEVWFENHATLKQFGNSEAGKKWAADHGTFIGRVQRFLVEEHKIRP